MATRILIVDDHPLTREALSSLLDRSGFAVAGEAADGEEAIELARRLQPELVLLDLSMPGMDGLQALPRLREAAPGCEVVVLTASGTEDNLLAAIRGGAARPRGRSAPPARRASRHGRDREAALHLRAHRALAREEPAPQAGRLLSPPGARGARRRARVTGIPHRGGCEITHGGRLEGDDRCEPRVDTQGDTFLLRCWSAVASVLPRRVERPAFRAGRFVA